MQETLTRVWENLGDRITGPMAFRLILQPTIASIVAIRAGWRDAQEGRPPYFWGVLSDPAHRRDLLRQGWKDVGKVFLLAIVLDVVYQLIVAKWVYPFETLIVAIALAFLPYLLLRGLVTRLVRGRVKEPGESKTNPAQ